jgi:hypothetical protein
MDALITLRMGGDALEDGIVPWTASRRAPGEQSLRLAIEVDRGKETTSTIIDKALAYQRANTPEWQALNGPYPTPTWVVKTERRRDSILAAWSNAWPVGSWHMTTDEGLQLDHWLHYEHGSISAGPLLTHERAG